MIDEQWEQTRRHWIFQGRPKRYDLAEKLVPGDCSSWTASRYADDFRPYDSVYLWRAGGEDAIYGWGVIDREPAGDAASDPEKTKTDRRVDVEYMVRFDSPLSRSAIQEAPGLTQLNILRNASGTNFRVTPFEAIALNQLARSADEKPPPDPWRSGNGGFNGSMLDSYRYSRPLRRTLAGAARYALEAGANFELEPVSSAWSRRG